MKISQIVAVDSIDCAIKRRRVFWKEKKVGYKIVFLVLRSLDRNKAQGFSALLLCLYAGRMIRNAMVSFRKEMGFMPSIVKKGAYLRGPIGLFPSSCAWLNAWLQFVLYLPRFSEMICFGEKAFAPLLVFVEQYMQDQQEGKIICTANTLPLLEIFHRRQVCFYSLFRGFFISLFPEKIGASSLVLQSSILLHPEWVMRDQDLRSGQVFSQDPQELILVNEGGSSRAFKRQICFGVKRRLYDLHAFIELCKSGDRPCFIAYIRMNSIWYQCEDAKVREVSSSMLGIPLSRGVVFHYKTIKI